MFSGLLLLAVLLLIFFLVTFLSLAVVVVVVTLIFGNMSGIFSSFFKKNPVSGFRKGLENYSINYINLDMIRQSRIKKGGKEKFSMPSMARQSIKFYLFKVDIV